MISRAVAGVAGPLCRSALAAAGDRVLQVQGDRRRRWPALRRTAPIDPRFPVAIAVTLRAVAVEAVPDGASRDPLECPRVAQARLSRTAQSPVWVGGTAVSAVVDDCARTCSTPARSVADRRRMPPVRLLTIFAGSAMLRPARTPSRTLCIVPMILGGGPPVSPWMYDVLSTPASGYDRRIHVGRCRSRRSPRCRSGRW